LAKNFPTIAPTNFPRNDLKLALLQGIPGVNQLIDDPTHLVEMLRLNTSIPPTPQATQNSLGVIAGDNAGYPNGRRPGDDVIDIVLRVVMGVLCTINIGCVPANAPVGTAAFTDGAPSNASLFAATWPYLLTPNNGDSF